MTTQVEEVSRKDATTAKVAEKEIVGMRRRGFFGAVAATVAGAAGLGRFASTSSPIPTVDDSQTRPKVSIHPNAIARNEEGSSSHG